MKLDKLCIYVLTCHFLGTPAFLVICGVSLGFYILEQELHELKRKEKP